jgi:hypothetical protein
MDEQNQALNETGEQNIETTTPVEEKIPEEVTEIPAESADPVEAEATETEKVEPKKGASTRIRELNSQVKSLKQRLSEINGGNEAVMPSYPTNNQPPIDLESGEVTPEQYRQHVLQQADTLVNLRLKQSEALTKIEQESSAVMTEYPQLNPDSDQFDKELSETISDSIEAQVRLKPYSTSVKSIADKLMKPYIKAVSNGVAQERETITKQISQTALRPTSVKQPEKAFGQKSISEMEAELGIVQA